MKFWDTRFWLAASKRAEKLKNTLMKFWDTRFCLAARKRTEHSKRPWWNFETLAFDLLRGNVRNIQKYLDEILRHSLLIGCEETCGKVEKYFDEILRHSIFIGCEETYAIFKNTLMKFWDIRFRLAARKRGEKLKNTLMKFWDTRFCLAARKLAETWKKIPWWIFDTLAFDLLRGNVRNIQKYLDEILRHSLLIGCEETCGKVEKYFDEIPRHSIFIGCEETYAIFKNTLMKFWDTRFRLDFRLRSLRGNVGKSWKILWWNSETLAFAWLQGNVRKI